MIVLQPYSKKTYRYIKTTSGLIALCLFVYLIDSIIGQIHMFLFGQTREIKQQLQIHLLTIINKPNHRCKIKK